MVTSSKPWSQLRLEPYVRRRWPHALISWSRVLGGRVRDPLVGRDILVGTLFGLLTSVIPRVGNLAQSWVGGPPTAPLVGPLDALTSMRHFVAHAFSSLSIDIFIALGFFFLLFVLGMILRRGALPPWRSFLFFFRSVCWERRLLCA